MSNALQSYHFLSSLRSGRKIFGFSLADTVSSSSKRWLASNWARNSLSFKRQVRAVHTTFRMSVPGTSAVRKENKEYLRDKKMIPEASPPSIKDIDLLYQFFDKSNKLVVLTGAGMSTECGIPDYRSYKDKPAYVWISYKVKCTDHGYPEFLYALKLYDSYV